MPRSDESAVVAAPSSGPALARAVFAAWDAGRGDPAARTRPRPAAELRRLLAQLRPTHLDDADGRPRLRRRRPAPADTAAVRRHVGHDGHAEGRRAHTRGMEVMGRGYSDGLDAGPADRWLACLPLHHVAEPRRPRARVRHRRVPWTVHDGFDIDRVARAPRAEGATIVSRRPDDVAPAARCGRTDARLPARHRRRCALPAGVAGTRRSARRRRSSTRTA